MCEQCVLMLEEAQVAPPLLWATGPNRHKVTASRACVDFSAVGYCTFKIFIPVRRVDFRKQMFIGWQL